jgi:hypothetical protein
MDNIKQYISIQDKEKKFYKDINNYTIKKKKLQKAIILSSEDYDNYKSQVLFLLYRL